MARPKKVKYEGETYGLNKGQTLEHLLREPKVELLMPGPRVDLRTGAAVPGSQ